MGLSADTSCSLVPRLNTAFGCIAEGCTVVTAYATLGADATKFAVNQTDATMVIVDAKLAKTIAEIIGDCPSIEYVLTIGELDEKSVRGKLEKPAHVKGVHSVDNVRQLGEWNKDSREFSVPGPKDLAVIM